MTKSLWMTAFVAGALAIAIAASNAPAQRPAGMGSGAPQSTPGGVALLDITYLFKHLNRMKAQMAELKADVERAEASVKQDKEMIRSLAERLKEFKPGTPDYKQLEQEAAKRSADLQVQMQLQRREFLQREAKIYHQIYQEVLQEVEYFATTNNISMVLRFNGDPVDQEKPEDVLRNINKPVIYFSRGLDITGEILNRLNQRSPATMSRNPQRSGVVMPPR